ncbi:MAG: sulfatase family protein [Acidimicrobiia bacterium]
MSLIALGTAVVVAIAGLAGSSGSHAAPAGAATKPNILFVLTDDLDLGELAQMPILQSKLVQQGVTFSNNFVSVSLCCPSRTTTLRGQYSHNTGVLTNGGANGGFATAHALGVENSTVATWLHDDGYQTGLFGKYLNGYPNTAGDTYVPPGWDDWASSVKGNPYSEYDYTLNENGTLVSYGHKAKDYGTTVYVKKTQDFVTRAAQAGKPFFAYLAVYAPHGPATPAPQDVGKFAGATAPRTPNYNEADVSDKPAWVQAKPLMDATVQAKTDALYEKRIESLQAVDRSIGKLITTLKNNGQLANTYIVFTSDNGFHLGQHRLPQGKQTAYEEDIHVPLIVRGPGVPKNVKRAHITGNVDYAPTFAALAGATTPSFVDGRSLAPLLTASPPAVSTWRHTYIVEHWLQGGAEAAGVGPQEPADGDQTAAPAAAQGIPELHAVRTSRYTYIEVSTGEKELYDHTVDPFELNNIASTAAPSLLASLHAKLAALETCAGAACRTADQ